MQTIRLYWSYFRNTLGTLILLLPFFIAAWVFHLALGLGNGPGDIWMGIMGAGAVLLLFRKQWRLWGILFPELWRMARPLLSHIARLLRGRIHAGLSRVRADWNDLQRAIK
jgi:hypothetical protein